VQRCSNGDNVEQPSIRKYWPLRASWRHCTKTTIDTAAADDADDDDDDVKAVLKSCVTVARSLQESQK